MKSRRKFLLGGLGVAAAGAAGYVQHRWRHRYVETVAGSADRPAIGSPSDVVTQKRRLGRTNLDVSVIGIGAAGLTDPKLLVRAVEKGMNYVDTSICYGETEKVIRKALLENAGLREKLIIATKWDVLADMKKEEILSSLDRSLERLGVDVIDIMQIHWLGGGHVRPDTGYNRLDNPALYEAMEEAKNSGKVRFFGATSHDAKRSKILAHAIDKGAFDMLLLKMNLLDFESAELPALLAKAKAKDVGIVVMKSQPSGGQLPPGFEKSKYSIFQANLRWVLQHPEVACVVHSGLATGIDFQDAAASAAQQTFASADRQLLERYATALSPEYCRGCTTCSEACPEGIAIPHVIQFEMYDRQYGWPEKARADYRALPLAERISEACLSCNACTEACPYGVDAAGRVRRATTLA